MLSLLLNRWFIGSILVAASCGFSYYLGAVHVKKDWQAERDAQKIAALELQEKQAEVTIQTITKYVDVIKEVKVKGDTIIQKVPVYVTEKADNYCAITNGFVRLHDAAASNSALPEPASDTDDPAKGIEISDVSRVVAENYEACHQNAEQLKALQDWVKVQISLTSP